MPIIQGLPQETVFNVDWHVPWSAAVGVWNPKVSTSAW